MKKGGISFTNLTKKRVKTAKFLRIYKKLLPGWELGVVFALPLLMRSLNKRYRNKNKVANVLAFILDKKKRVGEIFLNSNEKKLLYLFIHACLHLLGYTHNNEKNAKIMRKKEQEMVQ